MSDQGPPQRRREREAAALRANLLRRKAQSRERDQAAAAINEEPRGAGMSGHALDREGGRDG